MFVIFEFANAARASRKVSDVRSILSQIYEASCALSSQKSGMSASLFANSFPRVAAMYKIKRSSRNVDYNDIIYVNHCESYIAHIYDGFLFCHLADFDIEQNEEYHMENMARYLNADNFSQVYNHDISEDAFLMIADLMIADIKRKALEKELKRLKVQIKDYGNEIKKLKRVKNRILYSPTV